MIGANGLFKLDDDLVWIHVVKTFVQEYDFVFDIELDEGDPAKRKLRLPYNRSGETITYYGRLPLLPPAIPPPFLLHPSLPTHLPLPPPLLSVDPYVAAEDFLSTNNLPSYYLDQVAEFIVQNAGEYQGAIQGATPLGDPFTG